MDLAPTTVLTFRELHPLEASVRKAGVQAITIDDIRWGRCDIKSVNLLGNVLARQRAKEAGAFEAILIREGVVTEGSVSNVVVVRNGAIQTAPEGTQNSVRRDTCDCIGIGEERRSHSVGSFF